MPLQQVLMNLISNAIKHHDKSHGCIEVSAEDNETFHTFTVKDDGPGISARFHDQIFKMFQTLKPRDQVEGSGMGLAMVRKNIELQGGAAEARVRGRPGKQLQFYLAEGLDRDAWRRDERAKARQSAQHSIGRG